VLGGLFLNVLAFRLAHRDPDPTTLGQLVTQGALVCALLLACCQPARRDPANTFLVL
jgi:hypothetical protein